MDVGLLNNSNNEIVIFQSRNVTFAKYFQLIIVLPSLHPAGFNHSVLNGIKHFNIFHLRHTSVLARWLSLLGDKKGISCHNNRATYTVHICFANFHSARLFNRFQNVLFAHNN